jgi:hypothetical protein
MFSSKHNPTSPRNSPFARNDVELGLGAIPRNDVDIGLGHIEMGNINRQSSNGLIAPPPSSAPSVPDLIDGWYSRDSFKVISFFFFAVTCLGIATAGLFTEKLNTDQFLNVLSSLLFLMAPSPLDLMKKKKKKP